MIDFSTANKEIHTPNVISALAREFQRAHDCQGESGKRAAHKNARKFFELNILTSNP
jgi:hypothetical protein